MPKINDEQKNEIISHLKKHIEPGDTIYVKQLHITDHGRWFDLYVPLVGSQKRPYILKITKSAALTINHYRWDDRRGCLRVGRWCYAADIAGELSHLLFDNYRLLKSEKL